MKFRPKGRSVVFIHLRECLFLLFRSTLVVMIQKTQESTPSLFSNSTTEKMGTESIFLGRKLATKKMENGFFGSKLAKP